MPWTRNGMMRGIVVALTCLTLSPSLAHAQSAIAGVVKDATGALLPGVTVEARSPSLIEKTRSVVTDAQGNYKIVDLRPGTYVMTFVLEGFATVQREGLELPSNFTMTINAELKVGSIAETVTVTGDSPIVDVQSNTRAQVLPRDVLDAVPTAHTIQSVGQLVVGVTLTAPDVGGSQAMQQTYFTVHGLGAAQTSVLMDGLIINSIQGDGAQQGYLNDAVNQEMVYQTGGGTADAPTGGVKLSLVPREGGNTFRGTFFGGYESSSIQSDNLSSSLAANGVKVVDKIGLYRDLNITEGGPILRDRLWIFGSFRAFTVNKPIANTFFIPAGQTYANCVNGVISCDQGIDRQTIDNGTVHLTWQVSPRNKFAAYMDREHKSRGAAMSPGDDPVTSAVVWNSPMYMIVTGKWTSTVTNKLLIDGGYSSSFFSYGNLYEPGIEQPYGSAAWLAGARHADAVLGTTSNASAAETFNYPHRYNFQGAASYVTGTHSVKVGFQDSFGSFTQNARANGDLYQNYLNGVPSTVTLLATPAWWQDRLNANFGVYAQDAWTLNRLTINIGARWDYVSEQTTGQPAQYGRFASIPAFGDIPLPVWKTFSPRTSIVYNVFGDGRTAVRFGFNRFEAASTITMASLYDPANALNITTSAAWTDLNKDNVAQGAPGCVYLTPGCEINFAQVPRNFGTVSLASADPNLTRPYTNAYNTGITHELLRGVSVSAEWFHNDNRNIVERNNILRPGVYANGTVSNASYRAVTVFSPIDGSPIVVYDPVSAQVNSAVQNVDTNDSNVKQSYNGFELSFNARLPHGARLFGGSATDRTVANTCSAAATNPNILLYCDQSGSSIPWRTQFKLVATAPLPWWGLQVSGSLQALPGYLLGTQALTQGGSGAPNLTAVSGVGTAWTVTQTMRYAVCPGSSASQGCAVGALVVPGMTQASLSVPLIAPGTEMTPRVTQLDLSVSKRITIGKWRIDPKLDVFNALNSSDYYSARSTTFAPTAAAGVSSGTYLQPGSILQGRIARLAAVVNW
jgi:Carboxypeptidase regulatory-like domain